MAAAEYLAAPGKLKLPFSEAVRVGDVLYLSGQIGFDASAGKMAVVPGGIKAETRQALENIRAVLERHGSSMDRVVKCLVMMADMAEWGEMNSVYVDFFPAHLPARSAMGVNGLALGARVEIECIATVG
jgi:2-iminobutanoate/2-iminopropanoate deaminase